MKYVVCPHLYIPWKFGERGSTPRGATGPSLSFFCLFVCLFVRHATMLGTRKPRRCVYALKSGGTGISPPDTFSFHSNFRSRFRSRSSSSSSSTTSGDIFYCSGSRQLNHSSWCCSVLRSVPKCPRVSWCRSVLWPKCVVTPPSLAQGSWADLLQGRCIDVPIDVNTAWRRRTMGVQKVLQLDHKEEWKCYKLQFIFQYNHYWVQCICDIFLAGC